MRLDGGQRRLLDVRLDGLEVRFDEEAGEALGAFGAAALAAQALSAASPMAAATELAEPGLGCGSVGSQILDAARLAPPSATRPLVGPRLSVAMPRWMASPPRSAPLSLDTIALSSIDVMLVSTPPRFPPRRSISFVAKTAMQAQRLEAKGAGLSSFCADLAHFFCGTTERGDRLARAQLPFQGSVKGWYTSIQILVALLIFSNFVVNA
ncbi:hypothetical protein T492DRAFT_868793, partial [Pavlovales sp. CCMP2436]